MSALRSLGPQRAWPGSQMARLRLAVRPGAPCGDHQARSCFCAEVDIIHEIEPLEVDSAAGVTS
jgi:hypothetical protein